MPIYVDVTQSSEDLLRLKRELESGGLKQAGGQARVTLLLSDGSKYAESGKLQFSDVTVDPGDGGSSGAGAHAGAQFTPTRFEVVVQQALSNALRIA